jgi:alpha-D-xyloside xylohydrolase
LNIQLFSQQSDGLLLHTSNGLIKVTPYAAHIVRVRYTLETSFSTRESLAVQPGLSPSSDFSIDETECDIIFSTPELTIRINRQTGAFTYLDSSGTLLTREPDRGGKTLIPAEVIKSVFDESAEALEQEGADGFRLRARATKKAVDRTAYHTKLEFVWAEGEALYGLGSHEEGMMNLRGQHQYLYQQNMKAVVPVLVSTRGYGIVFDNYSLMTFHDDAFGSYIWSEFDEELDFYFVYGPEFDRIVAAVRQLSGKAPMLPKWAFGYIQSKERYKTQDELVEIVSEYRNRNLPLDCVVLDWQSWPGELWGQKTFDPTRFPDPDRMMVELDNLNAKLMVSIWPIMRQGGDNWREMNEHGFLLGNRATYDAFQPGAREMYWKQAYEGLFCHDIDAWWCDCTEPFEADWKGAFKPEPEERMRINTEEAKTYLDPEFANAYSLLHSQGIYDGQRRVTDCKRVVNLTRSAFLGQQRYATITWSGDVSANWETLRTQIPAGLNFCITGMPYWTLDIGAFFVRNKSDMWFWSGDYDAGVDDLSYRELYVRWFQYGAFLPMFRSHGTDTPREIWRFGAPGDLMYETLANFLRLRYRLMPYIYALAGQVTQLDQTMLRALPFDFRQDPNTYNMDDQFLFGSAFLVNPVTRPMYYGAGSEVLEGVERTRTVYLPASCDWYDFWTGKRYTGGQTITADAPLEILPLYVRAGSIVPMGPHIQHTGEDANAEALDLVIFPGSDGRFELYEDAGDSYDYERGEFSFTPLRWDDSSRCLTIDARQGGYAGMPESRQFRVTVADGISEAWVQPGGHSTTTVTYHGEPVSVTL